MTTRATVTINGPADRRRAKPGEALAYLNDVVLQFESDQCLFWPFARNSAGYGHVVFNGKDSLVHRIACEHEHGPAPLPWHDAAHSCGNGHLGCCSRKHVRWATSKENQEDMVLHGRSQQGERHYAAKLTEADVIAIRASDETNAVLAVRFGVERSNISAIRKRKSWRHV